MKITYLLPLFTLSFWACEPTASPEEPETAIELPPMEEQIDYDPEMVAPGIISTAAFEGHASITPDGNELYYAIYSNDHGYSTIAYATRVNGEWTTPKIAPFSGRWSDGSPALSPDGKRLYFSSKRPLPGRDSINSSDLWLVERAAGGAWGNPVHLGESINTPFYEFSPSVDRLGNLYFCSSKPGGFGDLDVYYAEREGDTWKEPILLDEAINSEYHEGNVGVSPDGQWLFTMIQHKPGDLGYDDIHYAYKKDGRWLASRNLGTTVNTYTYDFAPKVSPDGKTLYFSSRLNRDFSLSEGQYTYESYQAYLQGPLNGFGNIYQIPIDKLELSTDE
ncbi:MAG: hypothetical protein KTR30_06295 [Saprospiraceae bacterium]|nr:hypothetical protein [Saprospiraceae bacterium]